jgi:hypothetical protein
MRKETERIPNLFDVPGSGCASRTAKGADLIRALSQAPRSALKEARPSRADLARQAFASLMGRSEIRGFGSAQEPFVVAKVCVFVRNLYIVRNVSAVIAAPGAAGERKGGP